MVQGTLFGGALTLLAFVVRCSRVASPALDLTLFRDRTFSLANAGVFFFSIGFTAMFFGNVFFLTERWHLTIFEAGLWISPGPLTVIPVAIVAGRVADRIGYRALFIAGGAVFAIGGLWLLHRTDAPASLLSWLPGSLLMGTSIGMVFPSLTGAAVSQLDAASFGAGSGVNQTVRQLGATLGVAIVVLVLGGLGPSARFENVYEMLIAAGVLTALGGALLPARPRRVAAVAGQPVRA